MHSEQPRKILIVLYYYHPYVSGLSLLAKMQAEGLAARGFRVTVLTTQHEKGLPASESLNGVDIIRAKILTRAGKGVVSFALLKTIVELSKTHDIVNPHLPMAHFGLVIPFIDTNKLMPQYHCDLNLGPGLMARIIERFSYWSMAKTLQKSSRIIVTTKDYFVHSRFAEHAARACEIYPPIDESRFGRRDPEALRTRLGVDKETKLVGFVGRIVAEKGLDYLLGAIPFLKKSIGNFLILIAGDYKNIAGGSVKDDIDRLVEQYPDHVKFVGHLKFSDLVVFYSLVDVLVLPSIDPLEAFGMVQVEAMFCGTSVVASDMPGVRVPIQRTGYGRLVNKKDPRDIAAKILDLLENPVSINRGNLAEFTLEKSLDKYEQAFSLTG